MRTLRGSEPKSPRALSYRKPINGCIKAAQVSRIYSFSLVGLIDVSWLSSMVEKLCPSFHSQLA